MQGSQSNACVLAMIHVAAKFRRRRGTCASWHRLSSLLTTKACRSYDANGLLALAWTDRIKGPPTVKLADRAVVYSTMLPSSGISFMQVWCSVKEHDLPAVGDFLVGATSECYFLGSRLEIDTRANAASASSAGYFHLLCATICMYVGM